MKPDLASVKSDLLSILFNMHDSLKEIDRVDKLIFPLLVVEDQYLKVPQLTPQVFNDFTNALSQATNTKNKEENNGNEEDNDVWEHFRAIESVIEESLNRVHIKVNSFKRHTKVLEKRLDTIIIDLKKKTYIK